MDYGSIIEKFNITYDKIAEIKQLNGGRINTTLKISVDNNSKIYLLQNINNNVFKDVQLLMNNIVAVTQHMKEKNNETINFISLKDDNSKYYFQDNDNLFWRMYEYIDADVYSVINNLEDIKALGQAIANFNISLNDFSAEKIKEIIPDFHNTQKRYETFINTLGKCLEKDKNLVDMAKDEIEYIESQKDKFGIIQNDMSEGKIPKRITHNDPKINNILFNKNTGRPICMIDLDTVMPGSLLFDVGDAIRSSCSTMSEDNNGQSENQINLELYKGFVVGFLNQMGSLITKREKEYIPFSAWLISAELGIRYLTDYLDGNQYFSVEYDNQNLDRAKTQLQLAKDIERKMKDMESFINDL